MTAQITGFVTRAEAGLRAPRSVSRNFTPQDGGVSFHHGGGPQSAAEPNADHAECIETWRDWQHYHMFGHGWVDIAYTGGVCNHGYAFAGRGSGVRIAANGTYIGNQNFYAIVWIGGKGQKPTERAYDAADWWIDQLRRNGGAGRAVKPHNFFKPTYCPGPDFESYAGARDGRNLPSFAKPTPSAPAQSTLLVRQIQKVLEVKSDGKWGPNTDARSLLMRTAARSKRGWPSHTHQTFNIRLVQRVIDTRDDGIWGPLSNASLVAWIKDMQKVIGVNVDGWWGPNTDERFLTLRKKHLNNY